MDFSSLPKINCEQAAWLMRQGVPMRVLSALLPVLRVATGRRDKDGIFVEDQAGCQFLGFPEGSDIVFWSPRSGEIATAEGRAILLGEDDVFAPETFALGGALDVHGSPLDWLRNACNGVVVIDWPRAVHLLRYAPRINLPDSLVLTYRRHMKKSFPEVTVTDSNLEVAA